MAAATMTSSSSAEASSSSRLTRKRSSMSSSNSISETMSSSTTNASRDSQHYRNLQEKAEEINRVLMQPNVDLWKIRALALSDGGLVNDTLRKRAWPKLVGLGRYERGGGIGSSGSKPQNGKPPLSKGKKRPASSPVAEDQPKVEIDIDTALMPPSSPDRIALAIARSNRNIASSANSVASIATPQVKSKKFDVLVECLDAEQIERDVARCTWHLLTGNQRSRQNQMKRKDKSKKVLALLKKKQRRLANMINLTLVDSYQRVDDEELDQYHRKQQLDYRFESYEIDEDDREDTPYLRYYQGYHDIACIFMHALGGGQSTPSVSSPASTASTDPLGLDLASRVLCQVSFSHFRDSMRPNFVNLQTALKIALYPLLARLDPAVHQHLQDCDMEPFFCLSWVLTWFSHDIKDTQLCKRLFDAFLSSHPLYVLYVTVAMMLHPINRQLILQTDCDFAAVHQCLASLPLNSCPVHWKAQQEQEQKRARAAREEQTRAAAVVAAAALDESFDDPAARDDDDDTTVGDDQSFSSQPQKHSQAPTTSSTSSQEPAPGSVATTPSSSCSQTSNPLLELGNTTTEEGAQPLMVPFQELLDKALVYMKRYPPRSLMNVARRYYPDETWNMELAATETSPDSDPSSIIHLLQEPPTWSLVSTAPSDWILKQRLRQDLGLKANSRKDRRERAHRRLLEVDESVLAAAEDAWKSILTPQVEYQYLKKHASDAAVIAVGYGPGPEAILARRRFRRRFAAAVVIGFFAMTMTVAYQRYQVYSSPFNPFLVDTCVADKPAGKMDFIHRLKHGQPTAAPTPAKSILATSASPEFSTIEVSRMNMNSLTTATASAISSLLFHEDDEAEKKVKSQPISAPATPPAFTTITGKIAPTPITKTEETAPVAHPSFFSKTTGEEMEQVGPSSVATKNTSSGIFDARAKPFLVHFIQRVTTKFLRFLMRPVRKILGFQKNATSLPENQDVEETVSKTSFFLGGMLQWL